MKSHILINKYFEDLNELILLFGSIPLRWVKLHHLESNNLNLILVNKENDDDNETDRVKFFLLQSHKEYEV